MNLWRKLNKGCVLLIAIPFLILLGLLLFAQWVWGGSIKPSLDAQYIPTAEYLFEHPQPTPSFLFIDPAPATRFGSIQVLINLDADRSDLNRWTYLFLNGQRLAHADTSVGIPAGLNELPQRQYSRAYLVFYQTSNLKPGFHLFRVQVGTSFNDFLNPDPKLSYEWAYRVE